jgi:sn-glycerol 3-phosphate transport system permease protein
MLPQTIILPLITLLPILFGALYLAYFSQRTSRSLLVGGVVGGLAGLAGAQLFMLPLNYCTFDPERDAIDMYFGFFLVAVGTFTAVLVTRQLVQIVSSGRGFSALVEGQSTAGTFKGWLMPWLLLAPTLIILLLFLYYPALDNLRLSTLLARLGTSRTVFVCVDNFTRLISDDYFRVFLTTFAISFAIVVLGLSISLLIAYMAYQPIRGAAIYRTLLIWPYAISPAVAGIIFFLLFNPTAGIINHGIEQLGGTGLPWLQNPALAPWTIIIASVWKSLGFSILFYIAGLQNVPKDLLEAAAIDGANAVQRFRNIVIPLLSPITFFLVITNITYAFFETFGTIDFLTRGGPAGATTTMIYQIYDIGISDGDLGKGAAQSIVLFVLVIGITYLQFRTSERRVTYGA